ncbi:MAG: hypothetical protein KAU03_02690 [Candidatus Altiarchaeales archaeon]|nr:hypothetical protein [Candidatus Altiarchaeales archaeon]
MKTRISLWMLGVLLCTGIVSAGLIKVTCMCKCGETDSDIISATGMAPTELLEWKDEEYAHAAERCQKQCAATCAYHADCSGKDILNPDSEDCKTCCSNYCNSKYKWKYPPASKKYDPHLQEDSYIRSCKASCENTCMVNETTNGLRDIIYYLAGIVAAIMLTILGYSFMTSTEPEGRSKTKQGVLFVILALIIIVVADPLVNMLGGEVDISAADPPFEIESGGPGGKILDVHHITSGGDEITVTVTFVNTGDEMGEYRVFIYDTKGEAKQKEPDTHWVNIYPGQRHVLTLSSAWDPLWDIHSLGGEYTIWLKEQPDEWKDNKGPVSVP